MTHINSNEQFIAKIFERLTLSPSLSVVQPFVHFCLLDAKNGRKLMPQHLGPGLKFLELGFQERSLGSAQDPTLIVRLTWLTVVTAYWLAWGIQLALGLHLDGVAGTPLLHFQELCATDLHNFDFDQLLASRILLHLPQDRCAALCLGLSFTIYQAHEKLVDSKTNSVCLRFAFHEAHFFVLLLHQIIYDILFRTITVSRKCQPTKRPNIFNI